MFCIRICTLNLSAVAAKVGIEWARTSRSCQKAGSCMHWGSIHNIHTLVNHDSDCQIARLPDCLIAGMLDCQIGGFSDCWIARLLDCRIARLLDCQIAARWLDSQIAGLAGLLDCPIARLPNCPIAKLLDCRIVWLLWVVWKRRIWVQWFGKTDYI